MPGRLTISSVSGLLIEEVIRDRQQFSHDDDLASWQASDFNGALPGLLFILVYSYRIGTFTDTPNVPALSSDELENIIQIDTVIWSDALDEENGQRNRMTLFTAEIPAIVDGTINRSWNEPSDTQHDSSLTMTMVYGATGVVQSNSIATIINPIEAPLSAFAGPNNLALAFTPGNVTAEPVAPLIAVPGTFGPKAAYAVGEVLNPSFNYTSGSGKRAIIAAEVAM